MVKLNKWLVNGSLAAASIIGSVLYVNQNKSHVKLMQSLHSFQV